MKAKRPARTARLSAAKKTHSAASHSIQVLNAAMGTMEVEADPGELARQLANAAVAQPGVTGVRVWRIVGEETSIWHECGKLPPADPELALQALHGKFAPRKLGGAIRWACPLANNGNVFGVLEAASTGSASFDEEARDGLQLLSRYAGVALAHTERRQAVEDLSSIVDATKKLNSTLDLGELINIILQMATRQTGADRGTVFLVDSEHQEIWSLVGLGLAQQEIRLPVTKGIAGSVARDGKTVNLRDAYDDPRFERDWDRRLGYRTKALLCLPIRNKDAEIIGVLQLLNKRGGPFTAADEGFLSALSDHVALALENAQLHRELLAKQKLERDLTLARNIQRGLLPENPPQVAGFDIAVSHTPSQMVGGDYYDFVSLGPDSLLTVVADVEGKGVASALVMANLQATLRALVQHVHALERIVGSINNMIQADNRGQKFLSLWAGLLDTRQGVLHYINAGHVPPVVVRPDGNHEYLREGGMVVGIFPDIEYERGHVRLQTGDIVVACTDGITEAMDTEENEFKLERLVETVSRESARSAKEIVDSVLRDVDAFSKDGKHEDDRIIFILKVL